MCRQCGSHEKTSARSVGHPFGHRLLQCSRWVAAKIFYAFTSEHRTERLKRRGEQATQFVDAVILLTIFVVMQFDQLIKAELDEIIGGVDYFPIVGK